MASSYDTKMEEGDFVKPDPDAAQPVMVIDDDDAFEDTGELEMPGQLQSAWLVRMPRFLYDKWATIDQDAEIVVGSMRRYKKSGRQQLLLNRQLQMYDKVPRSYDMELTGSDVKNTYIFSEKDLPGYRKGTKSNKSGQDANGAGRVDKNTRFQFRRAIPKQTALKGGVTAEYNCTATQNDETAGIMLQRAREQEETRPKVQLMFEDPRQSEYMSFNNSRERTAFDNFVRPAAPKVKPQENKAARMPRNELLDKLFDCFQEYTFWSMRALKERLHQPEQYLKENLESMAELIRSGMQTGNYRLRPEARRDMYTGKDEAGGDESNADELDDLSDGDDAGENGGNNDNANE